MPAVPPGAQSVAMSPPRVLLCIVTGAEGYGVRRVWSDVFDGLGERGWKMVVAVLEPGRADAWQAAYPGGRFVPAPQARTMTAASPGRWSKILSMARRAREQLAHAGWLTRLAKESGASALMIQSPPESLLAGLVARRTGLRALWLVPNAIGDEVPLDLNRRIYRLVFRFGKVVPVSNSHFTDSTFGPGAFERHVVHLGADTCHFRPGGDPAPVRQRFGIPPEAPVIGLFARMTPSKGQDRLVDALARSGTPFHLLLCGGPLDTPYAHDLNRRIEALGLAGRVHMAGEQGDLRPCYAACNVIANMRVDPEPFGLTVIEAMASGKPVFAHRLGGPSETVRDGETGWLLPDAEVATIAAGLERVWQDRGAWQAMAQASLGHVLRNFRKDRFIARIDALARAGGR